METLQSAASCAPTFDSCVSVMSDYFVVFLFLCFLDFFRPPLFVLEKLERMINEIGYVYVFIFVYMGVIENVFFRWCMSAGVVYCTLLHFFVVIFFISKPKSNQWCPVC